MPVDEKPPGRKNGAVKNGAGDERGATAVDAPPDAAATGTATATPEAPAESPGTVTATQPEAQREPRTLRLLFISKWGLIHDLAWEV